MTRRSLGRMLTVSTVCISLSSCDLSSGFHRANPPTDATASARWWAERVDNTPREFLAAYVEAADVHRRQGSSATYVEDRGGHNMLGKVRIEVRLPCPPPDDVLVRMREKARGYDPTQGAVTATDCRGCTAAEAECIWRTAGESVRRDRTE